MSFEATVQAQTTLRIGLAEDPDILDPTLARTYVGRIVFASFCDKLFDIDEKLNIVPQLALSARDLRRRQGGHDQAAAGREIPRRRAVRRRGREILARASPDACRPRSASRSWRSVDHVDVVDPLTIKLVLKAPFSPLIAQLTDRAGMMVSPKAAKEAGDKFGLKPVCAGPYKFVERVQQDRIVFEKFADYWNKDNVYIDRIVYLPIVDATVRLANLKSGGLDLIERAAGDRHQGRARRPEAQTVDRDRARLSGRHAQRRQGQGQGTAQPVRQGAPGARSVDRSRGDQPGGVQRRVQARQPVGQPGSSLLPEGLPIRERDVAKAKALLKEAGVTAPVSVDFMVPKGAETEAVAQVIQSMAAEAGFDMKIRVTEFATSLKQAEAGEYQAYHAGLERTHRSRRQFLRLPAQPNAPQNYSAWANPEADKALDDARLVTDPAQRKAIYEKPDQARAGRRAACSTSITAGS